MSRLSEQFHQRDQELAQQSRAHGMAILEQAREAERAEQATRLLRYQQQHAPVDLAAGILDDPQPAPTPTESSAAVVPAHEHYSDDAVLAVWVSLDAAEAQRDRLQAALLAATPPESQELRHLLDAIETQISHLEGRLERLHADREATLERLREQVRRSTPEGSYGILA